MQSEEYIRAVEDSLRASYFDNMLPEEALDVDVVERILRIPINSHPGTESFVEKFSCFYKGTGTDGFWEPNLREVAIIYTPELGNDENQAPIKTIRKVIDTAHEHYEEAAPERDEKVFVYILFTTTGASDLLRRVIKNGMVVDRPDYALLPVLADLDESRLTYETEQQEPAGFFADPFADQITENASEYFRVSDQ